MEYTRRQTLGATAGILALLSYENTTEILEHGMLPPQSTVVTSRTELERAFADLSPGETVWISPKNAPYRTTEWLDIDVSGVTVLGPGLPTLIKPADGANVGGIRIGHNSSCRNVRVEGVGYHGNPKNQDDGAKKLHGIIVRDVDDVTLRGNTVAHTHPFGEHGSGGSGISAGRASKNVRILDNRIHHFGDRGIQLGGQNTVVSGNVVTDGIDRTIACDLWTPDGENDVANTVIISENILGNCREGSLTGVASGPEGVATGSSHIIVSNNIGFGFHKSFCHVRGPTNITNVSIRGNVSTQVTEGLWTNKTEKFAGIAVDPSGATNITIGDNELSGYSRHGINVLGDISNLKIAGNIVLDAGEAGIRVQNASDGTIVDNTIERTGDHGILLKDTTSFAVTNNHLRDLALSGIALHNSGEAHHIVGSNHIRQPNENRENAVASIHVDSSAVVVQGNTITQATDVPSISDSAAAESNIYRGNHGSEGARWAIGSPSSVVRDNVPPFDSHSGVRASNNRAEIRFEKAYDEPPKLTFARRGGGIRNVEYRERNGAFVGASIETAAADGVVDVAVDSFG
ncbi:MULTISPECIES: right-handed parallel beta-helix repeat-containing protein [Haloprofundus]|uniref:right-handed parallel beta-helix repeat-containing protein n=1 Tax=Haloprofundus TaxID=1911573 RepID=UPI000E44B14B|nr:MULTISPECIES: right-handed parallel beta-helix repeat-containing protein [Haloprofundus]QCJ47710.1 right-handed parallel beta-helix repeat-containing protein [Haloprofundus sp. MHR1]